MQEDPSPAPYPALSGIVEISRAELARCVLFAPDTRFHLRVEFEDGTDTYLSFDGRLMTERDDRAAYAVPELWNFHVDGLPAAPGDVDFALEGGIETLEQWLLNREGAR